MHDALHLSEQPFKDSRIGIIDIGSNSIRLVIYDQLKRAPVPIYNEKVMCALGKGLSTTGRLNPDGVTMARETLRRFLAMGRNMEITALYVIATAAIRDAKDGPDFAREMEKTHDIDIEVISGEREARLGAYGVCSSMHRPHGITGDLGGGSLELVWLNDASIEDHTSLPLGSLRMIDETGGNRDKIRKLVDTHVRSLSWLRGKKTDYFYAIGGGFRALAKMHMAAHDYPLRILHQYEVNASEFSAFLNEVIDAGSDTLQSWPGVSQKRLHQLPGAAIILQHIIAAAKPKQVVFSGAGIREGYFYEKLSPHTRQQDGLLSACTEFATKDGRSTAYAEELFDWMVPLIPDASENEQRLCMAFCLLSNIALHIHNSYRAEWAYHRIFHSTLNGLSHSERITLSLALYYRYNHKMKYDWAALGLLSDKGKHWARLVGCAGNLAHHLSGNIAGNLPETDLAVRSKKITLKLSEYMHDTMGMAVEKRLDVLQDAYLAYCEL